MKANKETVKGIYDIRKRYISSDKSTKEISQEFKVSQAWVQYCVSGKGSPVLRRLELADISRIMVQKFKLKDIYGKNEYSQKIIGD